jgi:hypothetical protein
MFSVNGAVFVNVIAIEIVFDWIMVFAFSAYYVTSTFSVGQD